MGRPVLASQLGGMIETVVPGETGWLIHPGDVDAWTAGLARAIEAGPGRLAAMGATAANRARQLYSVDAMCAATLEAYQRVLEARA